MVKFEVRVADNRPLSIGDELTFFYPSTEWDMEEPFDCECRPMAAKRCGERIAGAKHANRTLLERNWLNVHIRELLVAERATEFPC